MRNRLLLFFLPLLALCIGFRDAFVFRSEQELLSHYLSVTEEDLLQDKNVLLDLPDDVSYHEKTKDGVVSFTLEKEVFFFYSANRTLKAEGKAYVR